MDEPIEVRGAREHNLQGVSLRLPRNQLICFTGVSGSGKSSLAFDTLYAEGQRRYIESLSTYARQFLGQFKKPDVDYLGGLSPAISIEQKTAGANPRSTVGTITEIHDYLRVLFARAGVGHCPQCGAPVEAQSREQIVARIQGLPEGTAFLLLAPTVRRQKGEFKDYFAELIRRGFVRARVDGTVVRLDTAGGLDRQQRHNIEVVVDRLTVKTGIRARLAEAVDQALTLGDGALLVVPEGGAELPLSAKFACGPCGLSFEPPSPQLFSFNSPQGMCLGCDGIGVQQTFDPHLLVPDDTLSPKKGAIPLLGKWGDIAKWRRALMEGVAAAAGAKCDLPWNKWPEPAKRVFLDGAPGRKLILKWRGRVFHGEWEGIVPEALAKFKATGSPILRAYYAKFLREGRCPDCQGARLNPQARSVRVAGKSLVEFAAFSVLELAAFFDGPLLPGLTEVGRFIATDLVREIRARIGFLLDVGLDYLSLDRSAPTLSGGELQRIRLAGQIGSGLVGVLYVLDEPSIGLHPRDNGRLIATLQRLRDQGNTVIVVEHDEDTMRAADLIVDFGPGPGVRGGKIVGLGGLKDLAEAPESVTGKFLAGTERIEIPVRRPVGEPPRKAAAKAKAAVPTPPPATQRQLGVKPRRKKAAKDTAE